MPAANVQLIVRQIRTGNEVSYEGKAVGAIRSGSLRDFLPANQCGGRRRVRPRCFGVFYDFNAL